MMIPISEVLGGYISDQIGIENVFIGGFVIGFILSLHVWFSTDFFQIEENIK